MTDQVQKPADNWKYRIEIPIGDTSAEFTSVVSYPSEEKALNRMTERYPVGEYPDAIRHTFQETKPVVESSLNCDDQVDAISDHMERLDSAIEDTRSLWNDLQSAARSYDEAETDNDREYAQDEWEDARTALKDHMATMNDELTGGYADLKESVDALHTTLC